MAGGAPSGVGSGLVAAFSAAEQAYNRAIQDWNQMSPEERQRVSRPGSGSSFDEKGKALDAAARALVADAADRHHIEQQAQVYLRLCPTGWVIDSPTFDGSPLEGCDGPLNSECGHNGDEPDLLADECEALTRAAERIENPTARQLIRLLQIADGLDDE